MVTAKETRNATACVEHVGLDVDVVLGLRFADGKVDALLGQGATVYVGDTTTDVESGRAASCTAVAVASGPHSHGQLRDAGADVVLDSLLDFPAWLDGSGISFASDVMQMNAERGGRRERRHRPS